MERPYEIGRFVHLPGRYVVAFHVTMCPDCLDRPGVLAYMLDVVAGRNVPVVHLKLSKPKLNLPVELVIFADLTGRKGEEDELAREFRMLEFVDDVKVIRPLFDGLTVDNEFFPLTLAGKRAVILRRDLYEGLLRKLKSRMGTGYAALLYHTGYEIGCTVFDDYLKMAEGDLKRALLVGKWIFKHVGLGEMEMGMIDLKGKRAVIKVYNSSECELFKGSKQPESHFIRGMIAGWLSRFFGERAYAKETKCIAKGDEYCEFLVVRGREPVDAE